MAIVTNHIHNLIVRQVDDHGLVVWFDPEGHYSDVVADLDIPDTTVVRYDGSFFALRSEIEPLMNGLEPPRLIVYVPLDPAETHNALAEVQAAGVILKPGQQPPARNTRLSIIARNALRQIVGEDTAASIEKQVEEGKLTLKDLDVLAETGEGITRGVVSVIFGTSNPQEIALAFLTSDRYDGDIADKGAGGELAMLLRNEFDVELPDREDPEAYRLRVARHILTADLLTQIQGELPASLSTVRGPSKPAAREACVKLAKTWRLRRDLRESYVEHANRMEKELNLSRMDFSRDQIVGVETFLGLERNLQRIVETLLLQEAAEDLVETAQTQQSRFWAEHLPDVQAHWALIAVAGQVLLEADRIEQEMKTSAMAVEAIFQAYTVTDRPWCLLDTYHRHMERRWYTFDFDLAEGYSELEQLASRARHRHMEVSSALAERFLRCYQEAKFEITGVPHQTEIFADVVKPKLGEGKTAYVWIDALRYEMARELAQILSDDFDLEIQPAIAAVPTTTRIGMAALLPATRESFRVIGGPRNRLLPEIEGTLVRDRKDRVRFLADRAGVMVFEGKLDDLLPRPRKRMREGIQDADLILITSQEIDDLCEGDNVSLARRTMDEVLPELRRAFRSLVDLGVETIVFAADHGYLFGDELSIDMKIDAPGGETMELHRRVWVGRGGAADPAYLRIPFSDIGTGGDLEMAVPWNFACFRVQGGAKAYFHGGLSPQELVIPVATLTPKREKTEAIRGEIEWTLVPGSEKVSTRFFSVQIKGVATSLFELIPPKVRVEIRAKGKSVSDPVSASYGFEEASKDVVLRLAEDDPKAIESSTMTLMILEEPSQKTVTLHLLDATTGAELARLEKIEVAIAI